jgi:WD40 repeat protein
MAWDKTIKVWNIETGYPIHTLEGNNQIILNLVSLDNGCIASGSYDKIIRIWDIKNATLKYNLNQPSSNGVTFSYQLTFAYLENCLLPSSSDDSIIYIWDTKNGILKFQLEFNYFGSNTRKIVLVC